jgi:hypothetical protein
VTARRGPALLALALTLLGACDVTYSDRADRPHVNAEKSDLVTRAEQSGSVEFDLRSPLTRAAGGVVDGRDIAIYEWQDQQKIDVTLLLPDDRRFTFAAAHLDISAADTTAAPNEVRMQATYADPASARDELLRTVDLLGAPERIEDLTFTPTRVQEWHEGTGPGHANGGEPESYGRTVLQGRSFGAIDTEIIVRMLGGDRGATVYYQFYLSSPNSSARPIHDRPRVALTPDQP